MGDFKDKVEKLRKLCAEKKEREILIMVREDARLKKGAVLYSIYAGNWDFVETLLIKLPDLAIDMQDVVGWLREIFKDHIKNISEIDKYIY